MNQLLIFIIAFGCYTATAQKKTGWAKEHLEGKVRVVRHCSKISSDVAMLRTMPFKTEDYWVDSFTNTGRKVAQYRVSKGIRVAEYLYKFDTKGNLLEENSVDESGKVKSRRTYKYDVAGNEIEMRSYQDNGGLSAVKNSKYTNGKLSAYEDSSNLLDKWRVRNVVLKYDAKGNPIEYENICANPEDNSTTKCTYDDKGNKIAVEVFRKDGSSNGKTTWKYDEHNNETQEDIYKSDGSLSQSFANEYIYDSHGNWIRRIKDIGVSHSVNVREIEYY